jgi:aminomethyltransferase
MVPFAGYALPVQYPDGVLKSHLHTRADGCSSLFDVGHMGQIHWHGKDSLKFLETVVVADVSDLKEGESKLTLLTNAQGGIIDDSVITAHPKGSIYMVVNGATKHGDMAHFDRQIQEFKAKNPGADVKYEYKHEQNLVALQGPGAAAALPKLLSPADAVATRARMALRSACPRKQLSRSRGRC